MKIADLSVRTKLLATLALLAASLVAVTAMGLLALRATDANVDSMLEARTRPVAWVGEIYALQTRITQLLDYATVMQNEAITAASAAQIAAHRKLIDARMQQWLSLINSDDDRKLYDDIAQTRKTLIAANDELQAILNGGNLAAVRKLRSERVEPAAELLRTTIDAALKSQLSGAERMREDADRMYTANRAAVVGVGLAGILMAGVLALLLVRSIMSSLGAALEISGKIAAGELGTKIAASSSDEFGTLLCSLQQMDARLNSIVGEVRGAADSVGGAAHQLSQGNDDLSRRTQEQAAALEETAASMEQMTSSVKHNADNARQANQMACGARDQAERGSAVVGQAISAMDGINESSRRIADIIGVIDEIAFQTNLLALNAAVEAARAGEQGRGFAVVATEVRSLAQRSATAAKEIKQLIGDSVARVRAGTELVGASGKMLADIVESVKKVNDVIAEISAASDEQASGIEQVNTAITRMDDTTQQNAALVEEAAAASKAMQMQAQALVSLIAFFRSDACEGAAVAPAASRGTPATVYGASTVRPMAARVQHPAKPGRAVSGTPAPLQRVGGADGAWQEF